jgi:hypothetical protein
MKKAGIATLAALSLATATIATSTSAEARFGRGFHGGGFHGGFHRGFRGGFAGPAIVGGLALGALAASSYGYGYGYGYPAYGAYDDGYGDGCYLRRRVVGYNSWGRPIVRLVRDCY